MRQTCRASSLAIFGAAIMAAIAVNGGTTASAQAPPATAQPGQCFGRVQYPDHVDVEHARVRVREAGRYRRITPAVVRSISSRVLVAPARSFDMQIPARYRSVVRIVTTPGAMSRVQMPARYRHERTRIEIAPSHLVWLRRTAAPLYADILPGQTSLTPTGEVLCRVRVGPRYATRTHRVLVSPARTAEVDGPPTRRRVMERILVAPARTVLRVRPAIYRSVSRTVVVRPKHETWISTSPVWRRVAREHRSARSGWAQVVCPSGLAPWAMQRLQAGLAARGYDPGSIDGRPRPETSEALRRFQTDHGMAAGQITVESARALGVVP